jgi:hypothetical protein
MSCSFAAMPGDHVLAACIRLLRVARSDLPWRRRDRAFARGLDRYYFSDDIAFTCVVCIISVMVVAENVEKREIAVRSVPWWRLAFFCVVMFSLVLTLATRTFRGTTSHSIEVQSNSPQAMRQHMDRDAVRWAAPVAKVVVSQVPTFYARVAPTGPPLPTLRLEENLHNRPPPAC